MCLICISLARLFRREFCPFSGSPSLTATFFRFPPLLCVVFEVSDPLLNGLLFFSKGSFFPESRVSHSFYLTPFAVAVVLPPRSFSCRGHGLSLVLFFCFPLIPDGSSLVFFARIVRPCVILICLAFLIVVVTRFSTFFFLC